MLNTLHRLLGLRKWGRLEIHLVDQCNLNCAGCTHYAPIAPERYLSAEQLKADLSAVNKYLPGIFGRINLLGGEPFLHPEIDQCLVAVRASAPEAKIQIVTNGTLLNKIAESTWETMREQNIKLALTAYPISMDLFKAQKLLRSKGIKWRIYGWHRSGFFRYDRLEISGHEEDGFRKCRKNCLQLRDGKIFPCPSTAYIDILNKRFGSTFTIKEGDFLPVNDQLTEDIFWDFVRKPVPFCQYCSKPIRVRWHRSEEKADEWIVI